MNFSKKSLNAFYYVDFATFGYILVNISQLDFPFIVLPFQSLRDGTTNFA